MKICAVLAILFLNPASCPLLKAEEKPNPIPVMWRDPQDVSTRNLFYGPGGERDEPSTPFRFLREDLNGTNPKFIVQDSKGVQWTVKLGAEARPETAASRLIWAAGYFANEDYWIADFRATEMPSRLKRGQGFVKADGSLHNVRLKRHSPDEKKTGNWKWNESPFSGTPEMNGLRVMMALINNWDLTDENNEVHELRGERVYMVSDVGSSLGTGDLTWPLRRARGDLGAYSNSKFVEHARAGFVDFHDPARPALFFLFTPHEYFAKLQLRWIGRGIPRQDARWLGDVLRQLSPKQIRDAFRAAGYSPEQMELGAEVVEKRIAALASL